MNFGVPHLHEARECKFPLGRYILCRALVLSDFADVGPDVIANAYGLLCAF